MFAYNEKITLTVMNVRDRYGKLLPISISLPFNIKNLNFPENISQLSIIEYHEGIETYGHRAFNINVGEVGTIEEIIKKDIKRRINNNFHSEIKSCKEQLVYQQIEENMVYIFASVQGNDIVVKNVEELAEILKIISKEISSIKRSVAKIRKLGKKQ